MEKFFARCKHLGYGSAVQISWRAPGWSTGDAPGDVRAKRIDAVDLVLDAGGQSPGAKAIAGEGAGKAEGGGRA